MLTVLRILSSGTEKAGKLIKVEKMRMCLTL